MLLGFKDVRFHTAASDGLKNGNIYRILHQCNHLERKVTLI